MLTRLDGKAAEFGGRPKPGSDAPGLALPGSPGMRSSSAYAARFQREALVPPFMSGEPLEGCRRSNLGSWEPPSELTIDFAEFLGLVWGDGCIEIKKVYILSHVDDLESIDELLLRVFGLKFKWYVKASSELIRRCDFRGIWFVDWLHQNGFSKPGRGQGDLSIPQPILNSPLPIKAAFLRGLFGADGSVSIKQGQIMLSSKSRVLVGQVEQIFLQLGLGSSIAVWMSPLDSCGKGRQYYNLYVHCSDKGRSRFAALVGFTSLVKNERLNRAIDLFEGPRV